MIFTYDNYSNEFVITVIDISFSKRHISNLEWQSMDLNFGIGHRRTCTAKNYFKLYYLVVLNKAHPQTKTRICDCFLTGKTEYYRWKETNLEMGKLFLTIKQAQFWIREEGRHIVIEAVVEDVREEQGLKRPWKMQNH